MNCRIVEIKIDRKGDMEPMWKRLKQKWKERKGFGSIEIVISSMIVLTMIAGLLDMITIIQRLDTTSQATGYVSRIVQKQGGVQTSRIENFSGKYTTTDVLYNNVKDMMTSNGISEDEWELSLVLDGGTKYVITPTTSVPLVDYGNRIRVNLSVDYKWNVLSSMSPSELGGNRDSIREVLSGYKIRDSKEMETELEI